MDRRESFIYDGAGLLADAAGSIHIAGPNGALNQAGWTDQMIPSFTGQLYDADAGLMYYRARWYDSHLGKFLNDDPMGFAAGDANISRYVGNAVGSISDPTGLFGDDAPWWLAHSGGPGNHCAACHPSQVFVPMVSPSSEPRPPYIETTTFPITEYPIFLPKPPKPTQLAEIPIIHQSEMLSKPPDAVLYLAAGGTMYQGILEPNQIIGVSGASPCVGVILIPPSNQFPTYSIHFGAMQPPSLNFPLLPQSLSSSYSAVLLGGENDPNWSTNNTMLTTLQETISAITWQQIPIQGYIPTSSAGVNALGQLIWTTPQNNLSHGYEP